MVDLGTVLSFIQATGIIVGVAYYILNIRISQRNQELMLKAQQQALETRRIGIIENITSHMISEEGMKRYYTLMNYEWNDYDEFERKYGSDFNVEATAKRFALWGTLNSIGLMLRKGMVEAEDLYDLGLHGAISFWWKYKPIVEENRRRYNGSQYLKDFEYLAEEMSRVARERDPTFVKPKTGPKYIPDK